MTPMLGIIPEGDMYTNDKTTEQSKHRDMRAFTYLGKKVKLSVMGNTLTIYPDFQQGITPKMLNSALNKVDRSLYSPSSGVYRFFLEHDHYHHDPLDADETHYHRHFDQNLDAELLSNILDCFIARKLINDQEKWDCLSAFKQVTRIPAQDFELIMTQYCLEQLKLLIAEMYYGQKNALLIQKSSRVLRDLTDMLYTNQAPPQMRHVINVVALAIREPTLFNIQLLQDSAKDMAESWPTLSAAVLALGAALIVASLCLGVGVPGAIAGLVGMGLFMHGASGCKQYYFSKEGQLAHDLSGLSVAISR